MEGSKMVGAIPMLRATCCTWWCCALFAAVQALMRDAMRVVRCVLRIASRRRANQADRSARRDARDDVGLACVHAGARTKWRAGAARRPRRLAYEIGRDTRVRDESSKSRNRRRRRVR